MFFLFLLIALFVVSGFVFVISCGSGADTAVEIAPLAPITPTFVTRDYSF